MPLPTEDTLKNALSQLNNLCERNDSKFKTIDDFADTVIDPLAILTHLSFSKMGGKDDWFMAEKYRRIDKGISNAIGDFHETVLKSISGWYKPEGGFDLRNDSRKIIIEIKNKHNTMNSSSANDTYEKCYQFHRANRDWTIYLAQVLTKKGRYENEPWRLSGRSENEKIRRIDGQTLYDLVTEEKNALQKTYSLIIDDILPQMNLRMSDANKAWLRDIIAMSYK